MNDSRAKDIVALHDGLRTDRNQLDNLWQEIARRVWPDYAVFNRQIQNAEGEQRSFELFDSTGAVALDRFGSALMRMTAPSNEQWHKLTTRSGPRPGAPRSRIAMSGPLRTGMKRYLEEVNENLFRVRYAPESNFGTQYLENCKTAGAFGPMATFIEDIPGVRINYRALHLSATYFLEDAYGRVDGLARRLQFTARQAADRFGQDKLPAEWQKLITQGLPEANTRKFEVIQCVQKGDRYDDRQHESHQYASHYVTREDFTTLATGGYRTFPAATSRFSTMPGEVYGRSPAMLVLPSLKMLNEVKKTQLRSGQRAVDPPMIAFDDGVISQIDLRSNAFNIGGVDAQGRKLVHTLETNARLDWMQHLLEDERKPINDVLLTSLFQILSEQSSTKTAQEVMERSAEKATLLTPVAERMQSEYHGRLILRELDILGENGLLPPMPEELVEYADEIHIEYEGELQTAQRAAKSMGILQLASAMATIPDKNAIRKVNWTKAVEQLGEGFGVPASLMLSDEEMEGIEEQTAQQEAAAALIQGAPAAASAARDFAQAQQIQGTTQAAQGGFV